MVRSYNKSSTELKYLKIGNFGFVKTFNKVGLKDNSKKREEKTRSFIPSLMTNDD